MVRPGQTNARRVGVGERLAGAARRTADLRLEHGTNSAPGDLHASGMWGMSQILLCHHALGLTDGVRALAAQIEAGGHTVHTPDLFEGAVFSDQAADRPLAGANAPHNRVDQSQCPVGCEDSGGRSHVPKFEMLKFETPISPKIPTFRAPEIDTEGISEAARLHAEREAWQDEQTTLSLEVQQSMAARLETLGQRLGRVSLMRVAR